MLHIFKRIEKKFRYRIHSITPNRKIVQFRSWGYFDERWAGSPRILMLAGHGYGNVGDEAQCAACIARWKRVFPDCKITLLSPNPSFSEALHREQCDWAPRVAWFRANTIGPYFQENAAFDRRFLSLKLRLSISAFFARYGIPFLLCNTREARILDQLLNHDIVHISGGGFLTGKTRSRLWEHCLLMRICHLLGKPFILTGHNIGVFQSRADRRIARSGLKYASYIGLRDNGISEQELASIGIKGMHVESTCDDALLCPKFERGEFEERLKDCSIDLEKPWIAINFHHWGQKDACIPETEMRLAEIVDRLVMTCGVQALFISMTPQDVLPEKNVIAKMGQKGFLLPFSCDYRMVRSAIAYSKLCLTFKHHPIIFAQGESVPVVSIALDPYYEHKNTGALGNANLEAFAISSDDFTVDYTVNLSLEAMQESERISGLMRCYVNRIKEDELKPYKTVFSF